MEHLYKWQELDIRKDAASESFFLDFEKDMAENGIRTRIEPISDGGYRLLVPLKDFEVAKAYYTGEVKTVISTHESLYHVFDNDLSFKNKKLYDNPYKGIGKFNRFRSYFYIAFVLVVMLIILKFVKIP
ncbi:MAG: hypothetical protein BGO41_05995 [Clostridiales bacterium 38-18]|nr:MAG: hypothetical protein BGO41_05995 [Clostridiales bacterium 38-18]